MKRMAQSEGNARTVETAARTSSRHPTTSEEQEAIYKRRIERNKITGGLRRSDIIKRTNHISSTTR
jgi:hypothetical protein